MYIFHNDLGKYPNMREVESLDSVEDVATLLDTFRNIREIVSYKDITGVLQDEDGYYHFILNGTGSFDLYSFINDKFDEDIRVSCVNANLVFPERLSRGIKDLKDDSSEVSEGNDDDEDDTPTGYLGGDDALDIGEYYITRESDGSKSKIPQGGMVMGRSPKKADYVVRGNENIGRVHCNLYFEDGVLKVHDFNSKNGTFVNNVRVRYDFAILDDGDTLTLADEKFLITKS